MRNQLRNPKNQRIVIKIGSHVLAENGSFAHDRIDDLAQGIRLLTARGNDVVMVASGAVITGKIFTGMSRALYPDHIKRPLAAIGQAALIAECGRIFSQYDQPIAQILLHRDDFHHRQRYLEVKKTIRALFRLKILPILNENDSVVTEDASFGDNDNLAAQVAGMLDADLLVLLSTVDGLYDGDPESNVSSVISWVDKIGNRHLTEANYKGQQMSAGGMSAKLSAIEKVGHFGVPAVLVNGCESNILERIFAGDEVGTYFEAHVNPLRHRKRWLAFSTHVKGRLVVDSGTCTALTERSASLLSSGIVEVYDKFDVRDVVSIVSPTGVEIARGMINYDWRTTQKMAGLNSQQLLKRQWKEKLNEVIHRDNMVILPTLEGA